jgi:hypothetical protein
MKFGAKFQPDPSGNHFFFCYRNEQSAHAQTHITCDCYTPDSAGYNLTKGTFADEKLESTPKRRDKKLVRSANTDTGLNVYTALFPSGLADIDLCGFSS